MSSTYKLESGLNNWIGSDKPTRADFVADNEILTSNAMWKATYDANNRETDIFEYTTDTVTTMMRDAGFTEYQHLKSGTQHTLTSDTVVSGRYDNIKFNAQGNFALGDTFMVNGTRCTGLTMDGQPLQQNFFVSGAIVICFQNRDKLYFAGGTADALLRSGGQMAGSLKAYASNRTDTDVKNIQVVESNGVTPASTMYIIARRKY